MTESTTPEDADGGVFERFSLRPVPPGDLSRRLDDGSTLEVLDLPGYLDRPLELDTGVGLSLYRLVQLFGTPNGPRGVAGGDQRDRETTTWLYVFAVNYDRRPGDDDGVPSSFLLALYDYATEPSVGIVDWHEDGAGEIREPVTDAADAPAVTPPPEAFAETVVELALSLVEEPVPATYRDLWT